MQHNENNVGEYQLFLRSVCLQKIGIGLGIAKCAQNTDGLVGLRVDTVNWAMRNRLFIILTSIFQDSTFKRFVEVGRGISLRVREFSTDLFLVVLLRSGPHSNRIAVITEIIDHNRVSFFYLD